MRIDEVVTRGWRLLAALVIGAGLVAAGVSLLLKRYYVASASFMPEPTPSTATPTGVAGLAAQLGLSFGTTPGETPWFYASVLSSREILRTVLLDTYCVKTTAADPCARRDTLLTLLEVRGRSSAARLEDAERKLSDGMNVDVDRRTGIVSINVRMPSASLSAEVANRLLAAVNQFNLSVRQSSARAQASFVETRLREQQARLDSATSALRAFYESNRDYRASPRLQFEEMRLKQQLDVQQEVYLTLRREEESARIAQVNNTPVITVIDSAVVPIHPAGPRRRLIVSAVMVFAIVAGVAALYGYENREALFALHNHPQRPELREVPTLPPDSRGSL